MLAFLVLAAVGLLFLGLGFLIWHFKWAGFIAGYDPGKTTNPNGLAKWVGKCMMATGLLTWSICLIQLLFDSKNADSLAFAAFMVGSTLSIVITLAGTQRFMK